jgi:molybdopterin guanine dinucleotide-containing S/N-oxide reductase-like protein
MEKSNVVKPISPEERSELSYLKGMSFCSFGHGGGLVKVDTKNGKIIRIRPFHYDEKYSADEIGQWKVNTRGIVFESKLRTLPNPHVLAYKKRIYSPNRIKYPLKRVDWDPDGERNPQNRGRSKFKRITWDEATDVIASEVKRVRAKYGPYAIFLQGDGHGETKIVHAPHGCQTRMFDLLGHGKEKGQFTLQIRTPDSWEGWKWGATHMWGMLPMGTFKYTTNTFKDIAEHTEMLLHWGADWETTSWQGGGQENSLWAYYYSELGIKHIFISPDLNYSAAVHADKWIPVYPGTDTALMLAIIYTWINEETYDKEYIVTHTHGFEKFKEYVMGQEDGVPKTPSWASPLCGVPSRTIKALAREWASKVTTFASGTGGPLCRGPYSTEPVRMQIACSALQALGKPGTNRPSHIIMPRGKVQLNPFPAFRGMEEARMASLRWYPKQFIPKTRVCDAILEASHEKPMKFYSTGSYMIPAEDQFNEYQYPVEGCSEIHLIWSDSPCWQTCWNQGNRIDEAYRSPKIETIIVQHPWLENDCLYADIILPICTKYETEDIMIGTDSFCQSIYLEGKCIEPFAESKSDYEAVLEVAKKLGLYEAYTEGRTVQDWMKFGFENSNAQDLVSWEELNNKGYYCVPPADNWGKDPPGMIEFYKDPDAHPLKTWTGKIEFEARDLLEHFPNDEERPPVPHWIPFGKTHQESREHPRAKKYPLLIVSNHGRWREHAQLDDVAWFREIQTCKVQGWDEYKYEPVWIHPSEAAKRGIKTGDIVKVYNERGVVLGGAYVTERVRPGIAYMDHGSRVDPIIPGKLDRGGAINLITPAKTISPNTQGQVGSAFLVEVEKVTEVQMGEWKRQYPEAFNREYEPAYGLRFNAWVEESDG